MSHARRERGALDAAEPVFRAHFDQLPEPAYVCRRSGDGLRVLTLNRAAAERAGGREVVGSALEALFPDQHELAENLVACMDHSEVRRCEGDIRDAGGEARRIAMTFVPVGEQTAVVHLRDVTEEHRSREALEESERRARALIRSNPVLMVRVTGDGKYLECHAPPEALAYLPFDPEDVVGRYVDDLFEPEFATQHRHYRRKALEDGTTQFWQYTRRTQDGLVNLEARFVRVGDDELIITIRDVSQYVEREREVVLSVERERNRIGQDLHDGLAQLLTGANLLLEPIKGPLSRGQPDLGGNLHQAVDLIKQAIGQTRELARGLSPVPQGSGFSLSDALAELAQQSESYLGITCYCECRRPLPSLSAETAANLYRIAQEAITNAVKHGGACHVDLTCGVTDRRLQLRIADDGRGIDMDEVLAQQRGMGLNIMRYRARAIGAELAIGQGEDGGTVVECTLAEARARESARGAGADAG